MNCAPVDCYAAAHRTPIRREWMLPEVVGTLWMDVLAGGGVIAAAVQLHNVGLLRLTEPLRRLGDGIEHGLDIRGRAGDDVEDFADGGLIFEGFLDLARARLHHVEQADVLDRDHCLTCKILDELDLLVRVWLDRG